ncbi:MAG: hypothetical protein IJK89_08180 [Clostridia bacterium]|nr:hypothetical protein [Clostridia bacterium]
MKKINVFVVVFGILAGSLLVSFVLKDGQISILEAVAGFAYLAAIRVIVMLANRKNRKTVEGNEPIRPSTEGGIIKTLPTAPTHKTAA